MAKKRVLVQAGHLAPREPGFESGTGTNGEQELVKTIRDRLVVLLNRDGRFEAIPMPGWIRPRGIKVDAAVFLHGDGGSSSSTGYSFGYPNYAVNKRLATLIGKEFDKIPGHPPHHTDNYTGGLRGYYGFSRVDTPGPEVVVEHGFLTNPTERRWLFANTGKLAEAEYKAILAYFGYSPTQPKTYTFSYRVEEGNEVKVGKTNYPGKTMARIKPRLKKGDRVIFEKL